MEKIGRFAFLALILSLWGFASIFFPQGVFAQQKPIILKYAHALPEGNFIAKAARVFEKCVKEKSKGNVVVEVYPAAQLFGHRDVFPGLRKGAVDIAIVGPPYMQGSIPLMEIFDLPFLFRTFDQVKNAWYGYPGDILKQELEKHGLKFMSPGYFCFSEMSTNKGEIRTPADFKGLKIRAPGPMMAEVISALGGAPVSFSGEEQYLALQRKVVDGSLAALEGMVSRKYWEIQKYVSLLHLGYIDLPMIINSQVWKNLPKEVQALLEQCAIEYEKFTWEEAINNEKNSVEILKEKGMVIYTPTPAEMEEFRKVTLPIKASWIKKHGEIGKKMIEFVEKSQ